MLAAMDALGNASSVHAEGRRARSLIEQSRRTIALHLGVDADRVVFTSGGTEANHLALLGFPGPRVIAAIEHSSVLDVDPEAARVLARRDGIVELDHVVERGVVDRIAFPDGREMRTVAPTPKLSRTPGRITRPYPEFVGQQTREVLTALGLSAEEIDRMQKEGVIGVAE